MQCKLTILLFIIGLIFSGCNQLSPIGTEGDKDSEMAEAAAATSTSMMADVLREFTNGQTATAALEMTNENVLGTTVAKAVADTLTSIPSGVTSTTEATILEPGIPSMTTTLVPPETSTNTPTLTQRVLPTSSQPQICFQVIDPWCNNHQGCSTVDVRNQSGMNSAWHIWSDRTNVDVNINIPAGPCTIVTRPGKYNFYIRYCDGEMADFSWQLNDNWWYKIPPCE